MGFSVKSSRQWRIDDERRQGCKALGVEASVSGCRCEKCASGHACGLAEQDRSAAVSSSFCKDMVAAHAGSLGGSAV
eukprot:2137302-Rhodomonas_salina.1